VDLLDDAGGVAVGEQADVAGMPLAVVGIAGHIGIEQGL